MITYNGDSTMTITNTGPATCTLANGMNLNTLSQPAAGSANTVAITVICPFRNSAAASPYAITVLQGLNSATGPPAGLNRLFEYTVDFKVDGETVPELSGKMQPVQSTLFSGTTGRRIFRFTNDNMRLTVTDTELEPAKGGDFLQFVRISPGNAATANLVRVDQPDGLVTGDNDICGATGTTQNLLTADVSCPYYADNAAGAPEYNFFLQIDAGANTALGAFHINILSNGVEIPGGPNFPGSMFTNSLFQNLVFRADSADGPVIQYVSPAVFELKATWRTVGPQVTLALTAATNLDCVASPAFTSTAVGSNTVSIFCRTYAAGTFMFTSNVGGTGGTIDYEFLYLGVREPLLSLSSAAASLRFDFTAVGTEGTPLTGQATV